MTDTGMTMFISYAHEDESYRWNFEKHLAVLRREKLIEAWHDRKITAGQDWEKELHTQFDRSHIIVLLISPDFMVSDYCNRVEVKRAMDRYSMGTVRIIPILIRPAEWLGAPFSRFQALPADARPISEWPDQDAAYRDIIGHLRDVCIALKKIPGNPANPYTFSSVGDWSVAETIIDNLQSSKTTIARIHSTVIDKTNHFATVRAVVTSDEFEPFEKTTRISLDQPLEDSYGAIVNDMAGPLPANATLEIRPLCAGEDKLFIGGKTYYTTWTEKEVEYRAGRDRMIQKARLWLASDIPLDGWIKMVMEIPGEIRQTTLVIDYGRGRGIEMHETVGS